MAKKKNVSDLMDEDYEEPQAAPMPDAPVNTVVKAQTPTRGHALEIGSRITNKHVSDALLISYTMVEGYRSDYVAGKKDMLLRMAIAKDGLGRTELIETLRAGGSLPDSYYDSPNDNKFTSWTEDDE